MARSSVMTPIGETALMTPAETDSDAWAQMDFAEAARHGFSSNQEKAWADVKMDARQHWSVREAFDIYKERLLSAVDDFNWCKVLLASGCGSSKAGMPPAPLLARVAEFATGQGEVVNFVDAWRPAPVRPMDVRVCVRQRPLLDFELNSGGWSATRVDRSKGHSVVCHDGRLARHGRRLNMTHSRFPVDHAWSSQQSSECVYADALAPLCDWVKSAHGATLLCYGQTGTGKTYTLMGVIESLARDLLGTDVEVDFFEIHGKKCYDLLADRAQVNLRTDADGHVHIRGTQTARLEGAKGLVDVLLAAWSLRSSEETERNVNSSRSHAICILRFCGGTLRLVDLAGSERNYETTKMTAQQHRESAGINMSLMALKDCFHARAAEQRGEKMRQPYRASQLTQVLRECFTEETHRTTIIATVSPAATDVIHTINTLRHVTLLARPLQEIASSVTVDLPLRLVSLDLLEVPVALWTYEQVVEWLGETESGRFSHLVVPVNVNGEKLLGMSPNGFAELFEGTLREARVDDEGQAWNVQASEAQTGKSWIGRALFQAVRRVVMMQEVRDN